MYEEINLEGLNRG